MKFVGDRLAKLTVYRHLTRFDIEIARALVPPAHKSHKFHILKVNIERVVTMIT